MIFKEISIGNITNENNNDNDRKMGNLSISLSLSLSHSLNRLEYYYYYCLMMMIINGENEGVEKNILTGFRLSHKHRTTTTKSSTTNVDDYL